MTVLTLSEKFLFLFSGLGTLQGILLAMLLYFHPKADKTSNRFLALFIFFFSMVTTMPIFLHLGGWQNSYIIQPIPLLTGPLLYLYIRSLKERITWSKALPHFLLFVVFFFPTYWNVARFAEKYPDALALPADILHSPVTIALNFLKLGQSVVYFLLARKTLKVYQRSIKHLAAETNGVDLKWGQVLVNGYMMIVLSAIILFAIMIRFPEHFSMLLLATMSLSTPYVYAVTYKGILQKTIWQMNPGISKEQVAEQISQLEKARPAKVNDKIGEVAAKIIELMERNKLYQETELTLQLLADKLQAPCYQVSQAFNEGMNRNFYDVVNGYRVEEAKRLLIEPGSRNFTILSIGFEAGFNSKTTFNTVFKKFTGLTPSEFREQSRPKVA